jgi:ribosome maturation factor RimP
MKPEELRPYIEQALEQLQIDLVELAIHGYGNRTIVRVLVDEMGGIRIGRVTEASRAIADVLDQKDLIPNRYTLEVSSPGVDRPLKTARDFLRHVGRKVKVTYKQQDQSISETGTIASVEGSTLQLSTEAGLTGLSLDQIQTAVIMIEF